MKMFSLEGKVAMVTGASRGLGSEIAKAFAEAGARVILVARDRAKLKSVADAIQRSGQRADVEVIDLANERDVVSAIERIKGNYGSPDILVNNAGSMPRMPLLESTSDAWDEAYNVNVKSVYILCREVSRTMIDRGWGRIVNVTSYTAVVGRDNLQAYSSSKAALAGLTRSLACELGVHGITVNNISPGLFMTDMAVSFKDNPTALNKYRGLIALARPGEPREIAGAALFLASDAGSYVTGTTIDVDGGVAHVMPVRYP